MDIHNHSQRDIAEITESGLGTVQNWLRGGMPGKQKLNVLADEFDVDPLDFLASPYDLLYSYSMSFAYKAFLGNYDVKITLSALVRLLHELSVFRNPVTDPLEGLPESALQAILPQLEARARADAEQKVLAFADDNFLRTLVNENREKLTKLLAADAEPTDSSDPASE